MLKPEELSNFGKLWNCHTEEEIEGLVHELCHVATLNLQIWPCNGHYMDLHDSLKKEIRQKPKAARDWNEVQTLAAESLIFKSVGKEIDVPELLALGVDVDIREIPTFVEQIRWISETSKIKTFATKVAKFIRKSELYVRF